MKPKGTSKPTFCVGATVEDFVHPHYETVFSFSSARDLSLFGRRNKRAGPAFTGQRCNRMVALSGCEWEPMIEKAAQIPLNG